MARAPRRHTQGPDREPPVQLAKKGFASQPLSGNRFRYARPAHGPLSIHQGPPLRQLIPNPLLLAPTPCRSGPPPTPTQPLCRLAMCRLAMCRRPLRAPPFSRSTARQCHHSPPAPWSPFHGAGQCQDRVALRLSAAAPVCRPAGPRTPAPPPALPWPSTPSASFTLAHRPQSHCRW